MLSILRTLATELNVRPNQVEAAVQLLDGGATVPFIARYRKEVTEGLDDTQLRTLEERLGYLREMEERRAAILKSIEEQGKLTDDLRQKIQAADTMTALEDLYQPYKPKRRTRAGSPEKEGGRIFSATSRPSRSSRARNTWPMPPAPSRPTIS